MEHVKHMPAQVADGQSRLTPVRQRDRNFRDARFVSCLFALGLLATLIESRYGTSSGFLVMALLSCELVVIALWQPRWMPEWIRSRYYLKNAHLTAHCVDMLFRMPIGRWIVQSIADVGTDLFAALLSAIVTILPVPLMRRCQAVTTVTLTVRTTSLLLQHVHTLRGPPTPTA